MSLQLPLGSEAPTLVQHPGGRELPARLVMDTLVSIELVGADARRDAADAIERAFGWFYEVERRCTRFDPASELRSLSGHVGEAVAVSGLLYQVVEFALAVAEASGGAFDPTVGGLLAANGFDRNYKTDERSGGDPGVGVTYRDVRLDPQQRTITLLRPLTLDLGAVAKGFAIDLAAAELEGFEHFAINAGGDLFMRGRNAEGEPWGVGLRHPRDAEAFMETLRVSDVAVCTSADDERRTPDGAGHHLFDPQSRRSAGRAASVTVIAPTAMLADALATAAFVLGPKRGIKFMEEQGVDGLLVTPALTSFETPGFRRCTR